VDWVFFVLAILALPAWWLASDPLWAVVLLTVADVIGFGPSFRRAYSHPYQEHAGFFALGALRNLLVIFALERYSWTTILFPAAVGIACLALACFLYVRRIVVPRPEAHEVVRFAPEPQFRDAIRKRFTAIEHQLRAIVADAEIHHVGSTAIPGSLTKGDLDVQVRVSPQRFAAAKAALASRFAINAGGFSDRDAISFEDYGSDPPVGVHLTVVGGSSDVQLRFRDLLLASEPLRLEYDELKRRFDGGSMEAYRSAKAAFVSRVLSGIG
jgi:GrpB-like predicted nucleotidyltransferase (UPF0157 family)